MGAITGIVRLDGATVERTLLADLSSALRHRGPLTHGALFAPEAALAWRSLTSASSGLDTDGILLAGDVRLDNRAELASRLGSPGGSDLELLLAAYRAFGESCLEQLIGDFAFALWDGPRRVLFCAVDSIGLRPLYYSYAPGCGLAVASEIKALRRVPFVTDELDEQRVADFVVTLPHDGASTFWRDVRRLPAAHALVLEDGRLRVRRFWSPRPAEVAPSSAEAWAEGFRDRFVRAVSARLPAGPCGAMLSGGLDSSSVVAAAGRLLASGDHAGAGPLHTFSLVDPDPGFDERPAIAAVLATGEFVHHEIPTADLNPLAGVEDMLKAQDEPFEFANLYLLWKLYSLAARHGVSVVLDGYHGDAVVSHGTAWLAELMRRFRWWRFAREFVPLSAGIGSRRRALANIAGRALVPLRWQRRRLGERLERQRALLAPDLARRTADYQRARLAEMVDTLGPASEERHHVAQLASTEHFHFLGQVDRAAAAFSVENRSPFYDRRLIEFCLAMPPEQKLQHGWTRSVLRRGLADLLPPAVRQQRHKTPPAPSLSRALLRCERERVLSLLASDVLDPFVDRRRVDLLVERAVRPETQVGGMQVWRLSVLSLWLQIRHQHDV